jgi:cellulose synthase/poly-beta-1,6-N-acetylglucosamine synthase-like glycosyltransferase
VKTLLHPFSFVPPVRPDCRATVVIPARDEALRIGSTIEALIDQRNLDGSPLAPHTFDVLVYANNCTDGTADVVRGIAARRPEYAIAVAEEWLPPKVAHIGTARRAAMNAAAARYASAGRADGILCATDADTVPSPVWLAATLHEIEHADVVTGRILIDAVDWARLPASIRAMLGEENAYQFAIAQLGARLHPQPHDPWPRHWQRSGPSIAVRLAAYNAVGGVPPVRTLEDIALYDALAAAGARIRHSLRVRVTTSARFHSRAPGGFGERISAWRDGGDAYRPLLVEDPDMTIARLRGERVGDPALQPPVVTAVKAMAVLRQAIACGVSTAHATRSSVASIAG